MDRADAEAILSIGEVIFSLRQAQKIFLLRILDPLQNVRIVEEAARFLERQQMLVEVLDHRISVSLRKLVDLRQIADVGVTELQEVLAPHEFLLGNLATRRRATWVHRIAPGERAYFPEFVRRGRSPRGTPLRMNEKASFRNAAHGGVFWVAVGAATNYCSQSAPSADRFHGNDSDFNILVFAGRSGRRHPNFGRIPSRRPPAVAGTDQRAEIPPASCATR